MVHKALSILMKTPEFALSEEESMLLGETAVGISEEWNLTLPSKVHTGMESVSVLSAIYGPRFTAVARRAKERRGQMPKGPFQFRDKGPPKDRPLNEGPAGADFVADSAGNVVFTTGAPDGGKIDFGGTDGEKISFG